MYIEKINGPEDVKKIKIDELPVLAQEIRDALLVRASKHGGQFWTEFWNGRGDNRFTLCI